MNIATLIRYKKGTYEGIWNGNSWFAHGNIVDIARHYGVGLTVIATDGDYEKVCQTCDGLIIPGSPINIDPSFYGQEPFDPRNEVEEYLLDSKVIAAFDKMGKPMFGICGGIQALNVFYGGTLERVTFNNNFFKHDRKQALEITNELPKLAGYAAEYGTFGIRSERNFLTTVKVLQSQKISDKEYMLSRLLRDTTGTEFIAITRYKVLANYQVQMNLTIANPGKKALIIPELNISAGDLQQWHNLSGDKKSNSQELHTIEYCNMSGKVKNEEAGADNDDWSELNGKNVRWFGVVNRFFAQLMSSCAVPML